MILRTIGKIMCALSLICWGLKHIFEVRIMDDVIWIVIGLVGGLLIWVSHIFSKDEIKENEEVIEKD